MHHSLTFMEKLPPNSPPKDASDFTGTEMSPNSPHNTTLTLNLQKGVHQDQPAELSSNPKKKVIKLAKKRDSAGPEVKKNPCLKRKAIEVSPSSRPLPKPTPRKSPDKPPIRNEEASIQVTLQKLHTEQAQLNSQIEALQKKLISKLSISSPEYEYLTLTPTKEDPKERELQSKPQKRQSTTIMDKNMTSTETHPSSIPTDPTQMDKNITINNSHAIKQTQASPYTSPFHPQNFNESAKPQVMAPTLTIFWKGVILTPTRKQLLIYKGKLDAIKNAIGYRNPRQNEWNLPLTIDWKGSTLSPTPTQLLQAGGNLHILQQILSHPKQVHNQRFHQERRFQN